MSKNVTLSVDEGLLAKFRLLAAERQTSVNALIRQHMEEATGLAERRKQAIARMVELANASSQASKRSSDDRAQAETWRWSREETYAERSWPKKS